MLRIMWLIYFVLSLTSLDAQHTSNEISYSGVYKGTPLFIQNPYLPQLKAYCIQEITVNRKRVEMDYNRSALILTFESNEKYTPVAIRIQYDSTCVPVFLNPDAITYHSVFAFESFAISDSSILWQTKGEDVTGQYAVESFYLGSWETEEIVSSKGVYGGAAYTFFPNFREGTNKFRVKYACGEQVLYSYELEHVYYPEPISFKRNDNILILSRSCAYVVYNTENEELLSGNGKEINISSIPSGDYTLAFNEKQFELFRKNDQVKVIKPPKSNN